MSDALTDSDLPQGAPDAGAAEVPALDARTLPAALEAVLLVVDTPTAAVDLAAALQVPEALVTEALAALADSYDVGARGMALREIGGGWRLYSRDYYAAYVERFVLDGQRARLTAAGLETLAVIAYRQPVTRGRIAAIRGVSVDGVIRTLRSRGLIEECGTDPDTGAGRYRTTPAFLERLGLHSLEDLPSLAPMLPELETIDDDPT